MHSRPTLQPQSLSLSAPVPRPQPPVQQSGVTGGAADLVSGDADTNSISRHLFSLTQSDMGTFAGSAVSQGDMVYNMLSMQSVLGDEGAISIFNTISTNPEAFAGYFSQTAPHSDFSHLTQPPSTLVSQVDGVLMAPATRAVPPTEAEQSEQTTPLVGSRSKTSLCQTCGHAFSKKHAAHKCHFWNFEQRSEVNTNQRNCHCPAHLRVTVKRPRDGRKVINISGMSNEEVQQLHRSSGANGCQYCLNNMKHPYDFPDLKEGT